MRSTASSESASVDLVLEAVGPFARRGRPTLTRLVGSFQNR
jgi:hypothetical protein